MKIIVTDFYMCLAMCKYIYGYKVIGMKQWLALLLIACGSCVHAQIAQGWYKVLTGKIGEMEATLHLHSAGKRVTGYLWFASNPMSMRAYAELKPARDSLIISANANPLTVTLAGKITNGNFEGEATLEKETNAGKHTTFNLREAALPSYTAFDYLYAEDSAKVPAALKNESVAAYHAAALWPKPIANKPLETTLKASINRIYSNKTTIKEVNILLAGERATFMNGWKKNIAKMTAAEAKDMGMSLSASSENDVEVMYEDERVITLANFQSEYTGGAHENYHTSLININKKSGAILQLSDVLTDEGIRLLPQLLAEVISMQYGFDKTKSLEQNGLFVKLINPSTNFYIANGNLGFYYAPYELLAFAYGEPNLFIPASALAKYIKPGYKQQ